VEVACLVVLGLMLRRFRDKVDADDAALYLQGKRVDEVLREMRAELRAR
jgi:hypothetical protein